jgi:hypothetical protein
VSKGSEFTEVDLPESVHKPSNARPASPKQRGVYSQIVNEHAEGKHNAAVGGLWTDSLAVVESCDYSRLTLDYANTSNHKATHHRL